METRLVSVSYWLGLFSSLIAIAVWVLNVLGRLAHIEVLWRNTGWFESFYKGAILFFLIAIATASYTTVRGEKT
jgi:hypothetical protein